jgi:hypothetical protein
MKTFWMSPAGQLSVGLVLVAAVFVAFALNDDAANGAVGAALVLGFLLLVYFGRRRSDTLDIMSGIGDERSKLLYTRAVAFSGTVMSFVLPIWWLVTIAKGDPTRCSRSAARSSAPPSSSPWPCSRGAAKRARSRVRWLRSGLREHENDCHDGECDTAGGEQTHGAELQRYVRASPQRGLQLALA